MDEHQHDDDEIFEPHTDGELSEDALFEWDGQDWVSVEHDPFYGFDEPQEWIEPPRQIYPPPRPMRNVEEYVAPVEKESRFASLKVFGGVLIAMFAFIMFLSNQQGGDNRTVSQVVRGSATPTRSVTATPSPTPTNTASPQPPTLIPSATSTRIPPPTPVPQFADCNVPIVYTAYVMVTGSFVTVSGLSRTTEICLWAKIDAVMVNPQLANDGQHLYFLASGRVFVHSIRSDETRALNNMSISSNHFDLSPDNTHIVYEDDGMLHIYDLLTERNSSFPPPAGSIQIGFPVWSPDGQDIYFSSGSQLARVSADGTDYQVLYEDESPSVNFYDLAVSDDGEKIAALYSTTFSSDATSLLVLNNATGDVRHFVRYSPLSNPQWLPTGEHIVVMEERFTSSFTPQVLTFNLGGDLVRVMQSLHPESWVLSGFDIWDGAG
ncbi:MAG: hypothetical protein RLP44_01890 [Aggregatilineales bacterium]